MNSSFPRATQTPLYALALDAQCIGQLVVGGTRGSLLFIAKSVVFFYSANFCELSGFDVYFRYVLIISERTARTRFELYMYQLRFH